MSDPKHISIHVYADTHLLLSFLVFLSLYHRHLSMFLSILLLISFLLLLSTRRRRNDDHPIGVDSVNGIVGGVSGWWGGTGRERQRRTKAFDVKSVSGRRVLRSQESSVHERYASPARRRR